MRLWVKSILQRLGETETLRFTNRVEDSKLVRWERERIKTLIFFFKCSVRRLGDRGGRKKFEKRR
jgi:hypothetical protein